MRLVVMVASLPVLVSVKVIRDGAPRVCVVEKFCVNAIFCGVN
jgi:hypothetical protein